jgi:signal transduction histidine kinase
LSYGTDALLLAGFAAANCISVWVPVAYGAVGLVECAIAYAVLYGLLSRRLRDEHFNAVRLVVSCAIQILFIVLVPQLAFFFLTVLFIVFGFATLALRIRDAVVVWMVIAAVCSYVVISVPDALNVPHATVLLRALVGATIMLVLARCTMLGLFSSHLRSVLGCRYQTVKMSLRTSEDDRTRTSIVLHEDLGQDLVGISLLLSACVSRLRRKGEADAADMELATAQLCTAINKTRLIATAARPAPCLVQPSGAGEVRAITLSDR